MGDKFGKSSALAGWFPAGTLIVHGDWWVEWQNRLLKEPATTTTIANSPEVWLTMQFRKKSREMNAASCETKPWILIFIHHSSLIIIIDNTLSPNLFYYSMNSKVDFFKQEFLEPPTFSIYIFLVKCFQRYSSFPDDCVLLHSHVASCSSGFKFRNWFLMETLCNGLRWMYVVKSGMSKWCFPMYREKPRVFFPGVSILMQAQMKIPSYAPRATCLRFTTALNAMGS